MQCPNCSQEVIEESVFCHHCGARIEQDEAPAPSHEPSPQEFSPQDKFREAATKDYGNEQDEPPERELWQGSYSKLAMIGAWIAAGCVTIAVVVVGVLAQFEGTMWLAAVGGVALLWLLLAARLFYLKLSRHYFLTNQHFIHESGLLWRTIDRIEVIDVNDVSFVQGPIERFFGVGTVQITSSDLSHPKLELPGIEDVRSVAKKIDEARRQERRKRGLHIATV